MKRVLRLARRNVAFWCLLAIAGMAAGYCATLHLTIWAVS